MPSVTALNSNNNNNGQSGGGGGLSNGAIAGIVVGSVVGACCILLCLLYIACRSAKSDKTNQSAQSNAPATEVQMTEDNDFRGDTAAL